MKIIILEDLKGFRKDVVVSYFPPDYRIALIKPISAFLKKPEDGEVTSEQPFARDIIFYPRGDPATNHGVTTMLYKQHQ